MRTPEGNGISGKIIAPTCSAGQAVDGDVGGVMGERTIIKAWEITSEIDIDQTYALPKRLIPDVGNAGGDGDGSQTRTVLERIVPDTGNTARDRNAGQTQAVREHPRNICNAGAYRDVGQTVAPPKCPNSEAGYAIWNSHAG